MKSNNIKLAGTSGSRVGISDRFLSGFWGGLFGLALASQVLGQTPFDTALETNNAEWESNGGWELQTSETVDGVDALASVGLETTNPPSLQSRLRGHSRAASGGRFRAKRNLMVPI